jgi:hypothetical protein
VDSDLVNLLCQPKIGIAKDYKLTREHAGRYLDDIGVSETGRVAMKAIGFARTTFRLAISGRE